MKIIKLGSKVRDLATGLRGTVTLLQIGLDLSHLYLVQPKGLDPADQRPLKQVWLAAERLEGFGEHKIELVDCEIPIEVLGTQVEDTYTGFAGMAINLLVHVSGCTHVEIQPRGTLEKTGQAILPLDFDIRRLKGKAIPPMLVEVRERDAKKKPSPGPMPSSRPRVA
jgi:hypothetical protein